MEESRDDLIFSIHTEKWERRRNYSSCWFGPDEGGLQVRRGISVSSIGIKIMKRESIQVWRGVNVFLA